MKKLIIVMVALVIGLSGCSPKFVYIDPEYPKIAVPRKVPYTEGALIRERCLWLNKNNTNLCGNDLKVILTTIDDLRTNDATFRKNIASYNAFVKQKSKEK